MQAAIQESKTWIKRKAILTHNNKPVQIRVNLMNNSISESYLIIEDMPNSNCFIQISPEILVSYTYDNSFILYLQFVKYEHAILGLKFDNYRDLEIFVSHLCKCGLLIKENSKLQDKFYQQNIAFLRKIKSTEPIKPLVPLPTAGSSTGLSPIAIDNETKNIWEKNVMDINTQFYVKQLPIRISFLTWNVASFEPDTSVIPYLSQAFRVPAAEADIVVIALQEIDMSMKSVVTGNTRAAANWQTLITQASTKESFESIGNQSIGGVFCAAFVKAELKKYVSNVSITTKKLGANGMLANKAALYLRMNIGQMKLCVILCHLAPHAQNLEQRNTQWHEIIADVENVDYAVFAGDLNYRITLDYDSVLEHVQKKNLTDLLSKDQLKNVLKTDNVIGKFNEAEIKFNPTFKFDRHCDQYDTSPKHRTPSWTDRILIRTDDAKMTVGLKNELYFETDILHYFMKDTNLLETDCFNIIKNDKFNYPKEPDCICYRSLRSSFSDHRAVHGVFRFFVPIEDEERKKDLQEIINAKYMEMKTLNVPKLAIEQVENGKIVIANQSLVWVQWQVKSKPSHVEISPTKGLLVVNEKITLEVQSTRQIQDNDSIEISVESGNCVQVNLLGKK